MYIKKRDEGYHNGSSKSEGARNHIVKKKAEPLTSNICLNVHSYGHNWAVLRIDGFRILVVYLIRNYTNNSTCYFFCWFQSFYVVNFFPLLQLKILFSSCVCHVCINIVSCKSFDKLAHCQWVREIWTNFPLNKY